MATLIKKKIQVDSIYFNSFEQTKTIVRLLLNLSEQLVQKLLFVVKIFFDRGICRYIIYNSCSWKINFPNIL